MTELRTAIPKLKNGKAAGDDGIPPELLKIPELSRTILDILNRAYESGTVPDLWHIQILVPIPKKVIRKVTTIGA
jgi:hypothetical protein